MVNKTDLALHGSASLDVTQQHCEKVRGGRSFVFCALRKRAEVDTVLNYVLTIGGFAKFDRPLGE